MTDTDTHSTRITLTHEGYEYQLLVPEGFEGQPTTVVDVLERAEAALLREGEWAQGNWFLNRHPELDYNDAYCNNWAACADGFILAVAYGTMRRITAENTTPHYDAWNRRWRMDSDALHRGDEVNKLVNDSRRVVAEAGWRMFNGSGGGRDAVPMLNDYFCQTRKQAEEWFHAAVELARAQEASD